ncbi:hypothetical protein HYS96_01775 [Candidatus Daviesbacteria bacterium]|nr:hypothetical protein [Candidatus Daviesbacteria bacterium]
MERGHANQPWTNQYYEALTRMGWRFLTDPSDGKINSPLIASHDIRTPDFLHGWREGQQSVEMSIVIVMPNTRPTDLPARVVGYVSTALSLSRRLREVNQVNLAALRIMSPCHSNVYANGGDIDNQMANAQQIRGFIEAYKDAYYPELSGVRVTLDAGNPITCETEEHLLPIVQHIQITHPTIASSLAEVAERYNRNGTTDHLLDVPQRPLIYLLTHPPAWGYSQEELLFARNGERRINFMPASELRYLLLMKEVEGIGWEPARDKEIGTVISAKHLHAPYQRIPIAERFGGEPTIEDLRTPSALQVYVSNLRPYTGRTEIAEIVANLNQIKFDTETANLRRAKLGLGKAPTLAQLISEKLS